MRLRIAKWGNSLAVRLPSDYARAAGLREGDTVEAAVTLAGEITLVPEKTFDKAGFLARLAELHAVMPVTEPVAGEMRR